MYDADKINFAPASGTRKTVASRHFPFNILCHLAPKAPIRCSNPTVLRVKCLTGAMPRRWLKNGPGLCIQLDDAGPVYPGATVTGRVIRQLPIDTSRAQLTIQLRGRDKVKLSNQEFMVFVPCRARSNLLGGDLRETLYSGPLHIPAPGQPSEVFFSCPFSIKVPYYDLHGRNLPFTFYTRTWSPTSVFRAFVDYWLEASLSNRASPSARDVAVQPIRVEHPPLPLVLPPPEVHFWSCQKTVRSQRLLPGMELSRLYLADRVTRTLQALRVPHYTFRVDVAYPHMIQLDAASPVPLYIRATPLHEHSSEVLGQRSRLIELRSLRVSLVARTTAVLQGVVSENAKRKLCRDEEVLKAKWTPRELEALWLPSDPDEAALDVGSLILKLRFGALGLWYSKCGDEDAVFEDVGEGETAVYPDFETEDIRHSHLLRWELELKVALETVRVKGERLIAVLGSVATASAGTNAASSLKATKSEKRMSLRREWGLRGKISGWEDKRI